MMPSYVINSSDIGVFVGQALGLGFWTKLDCAGQNTVCTFESVEQAQGFIDELLAPHTRENEVLNIIEVPTDKHYAGPEVLDKAGLKEAAAALRAEILDQYVPEGPGS